MKKLILISFLSALFFTSCSQTEVRYTIVQERNKDGVIHESGFVVVKPIYEHIYQFDGQKKRFAHPNTANLHWIHNQDSMKYAIVQATDGKYGVIDVEGNLLLKPIYDSVTQFFDGFAKVEYGGKFGLVDEDFNIVVKPIYDSIQDFTGEIAIVSLKGKYGCMNRKGELLIKPTYDRVYFQQEEMLRTTINQKWGYLDNKCKVVSKPIYDYGYDFSNGFAKVMLSGKVGYLNKEGKMIAKPIFTNESASF